jgi:hypothetical protein
MESAALKNRRSIKASRIFPQHNLVSIIRRQLEFTIDRGTASEMKIQAAAALQKPYPPGKSFPKP